MNQPEHYQGRFLTALLTDVRANTIAIGAATLVPIVAMVGGGIDASRFYMAQSRLQAACDAGALAARRAMDDDEFVAGKHDRVGYDFFDENYPDGTFGTEGLQRSYLGNQSGEVVGTASAAIPTSIMGIFGYDEFNLSVECSADINISNTDVMFVLDVTGSMQCTSSQSSCSTSFPGSGSTVTPGSKLADLQSAAKNFYRTVENATSRTAQVRYGFVPYSSNVNVGKVVYAANPSWLATSANYQSREPIFDESWRQISLTPQNNYYNRRPESYRFNTTAAGYVDEEYCASVYPAFTNGDTPEAPINGTFDASFGTVSSQTQNGSIRTSQGTGARITLSRREAGYTYDAGYCSVGYHEYEQVADVDYTLVEELTRTFNRYRYAERTFNLTSLYNDSNVTFDTGTRGADFTHFWDGCIEEANTAEGHSDFSTIPANAYDLSIDLRPTNNEQRWKPTLPTLVHFRHKNNKNFVPWNTRHWVSAPQETSEDRASPSDYSRSSGYYACPREALRLAEMSESEFDTYIDSLRAWGATYHDSGMIWGGRFISPDGIFSSSNSTAPNGDSISRHIVFMTDGTQSTAQAVYGLYGIEYWDRRVTNDGSQSQMSANHAARFQAACRTARNKNISVWVVAFGTNLTQNLIDCATPGRAYQASDSAALDAAFTEIAEKIAALRLTK